MAEDIHTWTPLCTKDSVVLFDDFGHSEVRRALQKNLSFLPQAWGVVGKVLIFSSNPNISKSFYFNIIRILTPRKVKETSSTYMTFKDLAYEFLPQKYPMKIECRICW